MPRQRERLLGCKGASDQHVAKSSPSRQAEG